MLAYYMNTNTNTTCLCLKGFCIQLIIVSEILKFQNYAFINGFVSIDNRNKNAFVMTKRSRNEVPERRSARITKRLKNKPSDERSVRETKHPSIQNIPGMKSLPNVEVHERRSALAT